MSRTSSPTSFAAVVEGTDASASTATAYSLRAGDTFLGRLDWADEDWVRVTLTAGHRYRFVMEGTTLSDSYLELRSSGGAVLASNDDYSDDWDHSEFTYTPTTTGTYYLNASSYDGETGRYTLQFSEEGRPGVWTTAEVARYLTHGYWNNTGQSRPVLDAAPGARLTCDLTGLGSAEQRTARMALQAWSEVTGLVFDTTSRAGSAATIRFSHDEDGAFASVTGWRGAFAHNVHVNIPADWSGGASTGFTGYFYQTYLHEIGHALGLGHAGPYNGSAVFGQDNAYVNDCWQTTVMSYFSQTDNTAINASYAYAVTPMIADLVAVHALYGGPTGVNAGNSIWGESSNVRGALGRANAELVGRQAVTMTIFDQGGTDRLSLSSDRDAQVIDLRGGAVSSVYGLRGNLSIAQGTVIENVVAGANSDRVTGNEAGNWLSGMGGNDTLSGLTRNDTLEGGAGADRLEGGAGDDLYIVDDRDTLVELASQGIDRVRASFSMTLGANFEALLLIQSFARYGTGNAAANTLVGNSQANVLSGGAGNDTLFGMAGNDTLNGNQGADRLIGGDGNDTYNIDALDTVVETANGGYDTVVTARDTVLAPFVERVVVTGNAAVQIVGNDADNHLIGNASANRLIGGGGHDVLTGGGGADVFVLTAGQDARVTDFQIGTDVLHLDWNGAAAGTALDARAVAGGVELHVAGGTIRLDGVTLAELHDELLIA